MFILMSTLLTGVTSEISTFSPCWPRGMDTLVDDCTLNVLYALLQTAPPSLASNAYLWWLPAFCWCRGRRSSLKLKGSQLSMLQATHTIMLVELFPT